MDNFEEFHLFCEKGEVENVKKYLQNNECVETVVNKTTGFKKALQNNHIEVVKEFLNAGVKLKDEFPLHFSVKKELVEVFELFIQKENFLVNDLDLEGKSVIFYLIQLETTEKRKKMIEILFKSSLKMNLESIDSNSSSALFIAIQFNKLNIISQLIEQKVNINATEKVNGNTPLHFLCEKGNLELLKLIIDKVKIVVTNRMNQTPLHIAAKKGNLEVCELLLKQKEGMHLPFCRDSEFHTPLMVAVSNGKINVVKLLLSIYDHSKIFDKKGRHVSELTKDKKILDLLPKKSVVKEVFSIQISSDIHLEYFKDDQELPKIIVPKAPYLALLGDIGLALRQNYKTFLLEMSGHFKKVFIISGNHEHYNSSEIEVDKTIEEICKEKDNLFYMKNKSIIIDDFKIIGTTLWTQVDDDHQKILEEAMNDYNQIKQNDSKEKIKVSNTNKWNKESIEFLQKEIKTREDKKCIVLTHHAPVNIGCMNPTLFNSPIVQGICNDLSEMMNENIPLWMYGHTHWPLDIEINGTRVVTNPRGYKKEVGKCYDPSFVVSVYETKKQE